MDYAPVTTWQPGRLTPGTVIDTARETCTVLSEPDARGRFTAQNGGTSPCHLNDVAGVRRHAVTVPAELTRAVLAHAAGIRDAGPVLAQAKAHAWHRVVLPQPGAARGAIVTYQVTAGTVSVSWDGDRAGEPSPNMATGDQVLSVQDEIPSMTFDVDSRRAAIANTAVIWYFRCSWCRETTRARTFDGQVDLGLRGSGKAARWFHADRPGRKQVPGCCLACGDVRAFKGTGEREATGSVGGTKTLELENLAWQRFRAVLPAAEVEAADRSWGIIPRRQDRTAANTAARGRRRLDSRAGSLTGLSLFSVTSSRAAARRRRHKRSRTGRRTGPGRGGRCMPAGLPEERQGRPLPGLRCGRPLTSLRSPLPMSPVTGSGATAGG